MKFVMMQGTLYSLEESGIYGYFVDKQNYVKNDKPVIAARDNWKIIDFEAKRNHLSVTINNTAYNPAADSDQGSLSRIFLEPVVFSDYNVTRIKQDRLKTEVFAVSYIFDTNFNTDPRLNLMVDYDERLFIIGKTKTPSILNSYAASIKLASISGTQNFLY